MKLFISKDGKIKEEVKVEKEVESHGIKAFIYKGSDKTYYVIECLTGTCLAGSFEGYRTINDAEQIFYKFAKNESYWGNDTHGRTYYNRTVVKKVSNIVIANPQYLDWYNISS